MVRLLRRLSFRVEEGGDHTIFRHDRLDLRTAVPRHSGDVDPVTMGSILEQIGLTRAEFDEVRRRPALETQPFRCEKGSNNLARSVNHMGDP